MFHETRPNVSSSSAPALSMNYSESSSSNSSKASTSQDNSHLFCEPGPSRSRQSQPQNQPQPPPINGGQQSTSGNSNRNTRNSEGLEYDLDALDNFPDPSPGEFDPSNSLSSSFPPLDSHPVELEDIQLQNLVPEQVETSPPQPSNNQSQPQTPQINKYLNNNDVKDDLASSASLGNQISLAFSRIPGKVSLD